MPAKLEWRRIYDEFVTQVRSSACECDITISLHSGTINNLVTIEIPPNERLSIGMVSINPVLDRDGNKAYWINAHIEDDHGIYDFDCVADNIEDAVDKALELAEIIFMWREGRIRRHTHFINLLSARLEDETVIPITSDDIGEDGKYQLITFTPIEARKALHAVEQAIRDLDLAM